MEITREKHLDYMVRLMPILLLAYLAQILLYLKFAPRQLAIDISVFLAVGLVLIALAFALYDHFHTVLLHRNHLEIKFPIFKYHEEILYQNIQSIEIKATRHAYYNVKLYLRDGQELRLYYLDDVQELKRCIKNRD